MLNHLRYAAVALPLALGACQGTVVTPVPLPVITEPAEVQTACTVLRWAVPIVFGMIPNLPASIQLLVADAQPALAACAAGNATAAIVAIAAELEQYLMAKGVHPPVGMPILRR